MTEIKREQSKESFEYTPNPVQNKNPYLPFIYAIVLAAGIFLGYIISLNTNSKVAIGSDVEHDKIKTILNFVEKKYVDTLSIEELETEAINELLSDLDPHSFYIPPVDLKDINDNMRGDFDGVGVEFFIVEDTVRIINAIAGGPSEEVGVMAGDKLIAVEDSIVAGVGISNTDVVKLLKGPKGTKVNVTMLRNEKKLDFEIIRARIPLHSLEIAYMLNKNTGFIKFNKFSETTYDEFFNSLNSLKRKGMQNLIIDLRQNGGGYLSSAVQIADELLDGKKIVVYTEGAHSSKYEYKATRSGIFEKGKLIVLVDENSASASEILSGALQDWDRALIIGRRTFGKGLVQEQFSMPDNSALRLTVARYYIPSGRSIQKSYEDKDDYHKEVYERYENGEFFKDSLYKDDTLVYYTKIKNRKVYGGGGIHPDVFVAFDTVKNNLYANTLKSYVPEFVYSYYGNNKKTFDAFENVKEFNNKFEVTNNLVNEFLKFAETNKWKKDLSKFSENKQNIKHFMKAYFAKQMFQDDGYYRILNQTDPFVLEALKQIENGFEIE